MLSSVALQPTFMEGKGSEGGLLVVGIVLMLQTFTDMAPAGPWDSSSFTRGVLGLLGMSLVYLAWFKRTFGVYGVAPTVNRWAQPASSWLHAVVFGLACLVTGRILGLGWFDGFVPEPAGLLMTLIGMLAVMNGTYVWLVTSGPLLEEE